MVTSDQQTSAEAHLLFKEFFSKIMVNKNLKNINRQKIFEKISKINCQIKFEK